MFLLRPLLSARNFAARAHVGLDEAFAAGLLGIGFKEAAAHLLAVLAGNLGEQVPCLCRPRLTGARSFRSDSRRASRLAGGHAIRGAATDSRLRRSRFQTGKRFSPTPRITFSPQSHSPFSHFIHTCTTKSLPSAWIVRFDPTAGDRRLGRGLGEDGNHGEQDGEGLHTVPLIPRRRNAPAWLIASRATRRIPGIEKKP